MATTTKNPRNPKATEPVRTTTTHFSGDKAMADKKKREELKNRIEAGQQRHANRTVGEYAREARDNATAFVKEHPVATVVGVFSDYDGAVEAWRANAQRTVDDAEMKYVIVHLHRLLTPEV